MFLKNSFRAWPRDSNRYNVRLEADCSWTVFDVFTGWPADHLGRILGDLDKEEASRMCALVNALSNRRRTPIDDDHLP